jgi:hypothetical protein
MYRNNIFNASYWVTLGPKLLWSHKDPECLETTVFYKHTLHSDCHIVRSSYVSLPTHTISCLFLSLCLPLKFMAFMKFAVSLMHT